jgi:ABC-type transport system, involved in lipoprotein release, permease component
MRALGAQRGQVRNLFLLEAIFLAVAGTVPGALAGILVLNLLHLPSFTAFTELGYFMDNGKLAFTVSPVLIAASFLVVILFTLLAALMPSRKAAKLQPAQALRTQF